MMATLWRWVWRFAVFLLLSIVVAGACVAIIILVDDFV